MPGYAPRTTDQVVYNDQNVNNTELLTESYGVGVTGMFGWDDSVEVRDTREAKPGQHGEDALTSFMGGRSITIQGDVTGSTWENLQTRKRALAAVFAPTDDEVVLRLPKGDATD
jgi:hypothetical protein